MKQLGFILLSLLGLFAFWIPPPVHASCEVQSATLTYADGTFIGGDFCDTAGNKKVTTSGSAGVTATATAAAPSYAEASSSALSLDLSGNLRTTLGTLISGEDQTNNLMMVGPGNARMTAFSSVTSATSSTVTIVPNGAKTFIAQIINATSETKAATLTIYGNLISSTTGGIAICTVTLPSTATTLQLQDLCPIVYANFPYYFYTATVYTSASSAPLTVYAIY